MSYVHIQVSAVNRFCPPPEVVAAQDHRTNTKLAVENKPATLRFRYTLLHVMKQHTQYHDHVHTHSTLTRLDEPYPMLILCGPLGSGKSYFVRLLVEEFPSFFGLGSVIYTLCTVLSGSHSHVHS